MTHDELVQRAGRWLRNTVKCSVVLLDGQAFSAYGEMPDAIGFYGWWGWSVMVECKTSLNDFYADKRKRTRCLEAMDRRFERDVRHLGQERWFFCPKGLIDPERHTIPEGWGVAWVTPKQVKRVLTPEASILTKKFHTLKFDQTVQAMEQTLLLSGLRYYQHSKRARKAEARC